MADNRHEAGDRPVLEPLTIMSDDDNDRPLIRNEDTLHRRAWIDRALAGVRGRLKPAELGEGGNLPAAANAIPETEGQRADRSPPRLYIVKGPR